MIVVGERSMPGFIHGLPKTQQAVAFARRAHDGQRRRVDGAPFILHPLEVASLLYYAGAPDHLIARPAFYTTRSRRPAWSLPIFARASVAASRCWWLR